MLLYIFLCLLNGSALSFHRANDVFILVRSLIFCKYRLQNTVGRVSFYIILEEAEESEEEEEEASSENEEEVKSDEPSASEVSCFFLLFL